MKFVPVRGFPLALPRDNSIAVVIIIDRSAPPADIFNMQQLMPGVPMFENSMETIHGHQWKEFSKQFPAQGPYLVTFTTAVQKVMSTPGSALEQWSTFKLEVASTPSSKTNRVQKAIKDMGGPMALLSFCIPEWHTDLTVLEVSSLFKSVSLVDSLSRAASNEYGHLWSMAPNSDFYGVDFHAFGMVRMQLEGFRTIIGLQIEPFTKLFDLPGNATQENVIGTMTHMTDGDVQKLSEKHAIFQITMGPSSVLVMPEGWLLAEKTGNAAALGMKRLVLPKSTGAMETIKAWAARRKDPSAVVARLLELATAHLPEGIN